VEGRAQCLVGIPSGWAEPTKEAGSGRSRPLRVGMRIAVSGKSRWGRGRRAGGRGARGAELRWRLEQTESSAVLPAPHR
jgi:hypothetical protein